MKEKYVEEKYSPYFIMGKYIDGDVNIGSLQEDTLCKCSRYDAERLISDRDKIVRALCVLAEAFDTIAPEEFKRVWYTVL